jgi:hypothetical protein
VRDTVQVFATAFDPAEKSNQTNPLQIAFLSIQTNLQNASGGNAASLQLIGNEWN